MEVYEQCQITLKAWCPRPLRQLVGGPLPRRMRKKISALSLVGSFWQRKGLWTIQRTRAFGPVGVYSSHFTGLICPRGLPVGLGVFTKHDKVSFLFFFLCWPVLFLRKNVLKAPDRQSRWVGWGVWARSISRKRFCVMCFKKNLSSFSEMTDIKMYPVRKSVH